MQESKSKRKETKNIITFIGKDGILCLFEKKNGEGSLESTIENIGICKKILNNKKDVVIVDISKITKLNIKARNYYSSEEIGKTFSAVALIVNSVTSNVIGHFMMGIYKMPVPMKLFSSEDQALKWLQKYT